VRPVAPGPAAATSATLPTALALILGLIAGALSLPLFAQPADPRVDLPEAYHAIFRDNGLDVPLVQLDVAVTDRSGVPVIDLGSEDFVLVQDKKRIPISGFSPPPGRGAPSDASGSAAGPAAGTADAPLYLALCLHVQFLESGDLAGLQDSFAAFLREELPPDAKVLLALQDPDLQVLEGFTTDRERILDRLGELERLQGTSRLNTEYAGVLREIREQERKPDTERGAQIRAAVPKALLTRIGSVAEEAHRELAVAARGLVRLTSPLGGLPGRKEVLWVTGRLPARTGESLLGAWRRAFHRSSSYWGDGRTSGIGDRVGVEYETLPEAMTFLDTEELLDGVSEIARARGVVLHTVDLSYRRGARSVDSGADPTGRDAESAARRALGDRQALRSVAESSGGRDLTNARLASSLSELVQDLGSRYTLAFAPPQGADGQSHEIVVRLPENRRLQVRHVPAYRARSRDQEAAERLVSAFLLEPYGGVEIDNPLAAEAVLLSAPVSASGDGTADGEASDPADGTRGPEVLRIAVRVPLGGLALVPQGRDHLGQVSIFSTLGGEGDASPVEKAVVPVRVPNEDLLTAQGRHIEYVLEIPHSPGVHRLALAVRDDFQTLVSFLMVPLGEGAVAELPGSRRSERLVVSPADADPGAE